MTVPRWLAWTWAIGGSLGILVALVAGVVGVRLVGDTTTVASRSVDLGIEVMGTVGDTVDLLDGTFAEVSDALRGVQGTLSESSLTLTRAAAVTGDLAEVVGQDVPASIESIRAAMPGLISTAGVVDSTMRALSLVGVDYDPMVPLDDALADIDAGLAEIPVTLRSQEERLAEVGADLGRFGSDTLVVADDLAAIRARLNESAAVLDAYAADAGEAELLLADLAGRLETQDRFGRFAVVVLAATLAVAQSVPAAAGFWLLRRPAVGSLVENGG